MLTTCVLGLLSSPRFVGCGDQFHFGPQLISNMLAEFSLFWDCGLLLSFILWLWLLEYPGFGLQPSCFGHGRAKNNSVLPCGLELCSSFVWDYPWSYLLLHSVVKGCFAAGMQWLSFGLCWLGRSVDGLVNPVVLVC